MSNAFNDKNLSPENCIKVFRWAGSDEEHKKEMFYTEEWFKKPLRRYSSKEKALAFMESVNDCVECYIGEKSITAYTPEEVIMFFDTASTEKQLVH